MVFIKYDRPRPINNQLHIAFKPRTTTCLINTADFFLNIGGDSFREYGYFLRDFMFICDINGNDIIDLYSKGKFSKMNLDVLYFNNFSNKTLCLSIWSYP